MSDQLVHFRDGDRRRTVRIKRDVIDVTMIGGNWRYDPDWRYTDRAGHHHVAVEADGLGAIHWTLILVSSDPYWCSTCQDRHEDGWLACPLCYQPIEPGKVPAPDRIFGLVSYFIDEEPATKEEVEIVLGTKL